ncbi:MAG: hypothetical protein CMB37_04475 [Euryarchaeota archaeon]|nr:hypothetical protein [Euryarchaeota archaeon]MED5486486.1 DUF4760 domain-containing protein [Candidatus Thermoplasmatota archaeon]|tara:strand:- start:498 stop:1049 length:552 start_codon:yes stop_codon:yes gene_type:complete
MDLGTAASWAEILGLFTILGAAIYSWFQIKELRRARDSTTAMSLASNFQSQDFVVGLTSILNMEFDPSKMTDDRTENFRILKEHFGDDWPKVMTVLTTWESIGVLIHRGDMDFHAFYDLFSGVIMKIYEAFSFYLEPIREDGNDKDMEWFIWLVDRVKEYENEGAGTPPAHLAFKEWKPKNRV